MMQFQSIDTPPVTAGELPALEPAWPKVFGVISVVLGGLGMATNGCGALSGLIGGTLMTTFMKNFMPKGTAPGAADAAQFDQLMDSLRPWMVVSGVVSLVNLGVSVWLLVAGIGLLKRRASAIRQHIGWSWVRIAMVLVTAGIAVASQFASSAAMAKLQTGQGGAAMAGVTELMAVFQAVITVAFGVAYPIVVLVYMSKQKVKDQVAGWTA
jgi:hypothetical protein